LVALSTACVTFGIDWYRHRFFRSNADLIASLPNGEGTRLFIDFSLLRRARILDRLRSGQVEDPEYRRFEEETRFDYRRDLDALAGWWSGNRVLFLLQGRFSRRGLWRYAILRGGTCSGEWCKVPASTKGRWTSFALPQPDVLVLLAGPEPSAQVARLSAHQDRRDPMPSFDPVWVQLSPDLVRHPAELPFPLSILAVSLQSANPVVLSAGVADGYNSGVYALKLDAQFSNTAAAETIRKQLELETRSLSLALRKQGRSLDEKDFTALLASGSFTVSERHMLGRWVVNPELLHALE
jgi:hypothetical protein